MYSSFRPFIGRIINVLMKGCFVLLFNCQSEPIVVNPPGGYEYFQHSFKLDTLNTYSVQSNSHTGYSQRLYSGILKNGDSISTFIKLNSVFLDTQKFCRSMTEIRDVKIKLISTSNIVLEEDGLAVDTLIQLDALKATLIQLNELETVIKESDIITDGHVDMLSILISNAVSEIPIDIKNNNININILDYDNEILNHLCNNKEDLGIVISYFPDNNSFIEFYSSDAIDLELTPQLYVEYKIDEEVEIDYNPYSINKVSWIDELINQNDDGPYYSKRYLYDSLDVNDIYAFNLTDNSIRPPLSMQSYDSLSFQNNIINENELNKNLSLLKIEVNINSIIENSESINFSLNNAFAFINKLDPSGDNQSDSNPNGTENNSLYDVGELFYDYGIDNCPDSLEAGDNQCGNDVSLYNPDGTEGNKQLDWEDNNNDGLWTENMDQGEKWWDTGIDGCLDSLEIGDGLCSLIINPDWEYGLDLNDDNYSIDPAGDDWNLSNLNGTEGNGIYDELEPFKDWGSDGLPLSLIGVSDINNTEGNGIYDAGEPFEDTGSDGLYNYEEYGYNPDGTEGNKKFDGLAEFSDCGEDNICNNDNNQFDDYNIDPNSDNWSIEDSLNTEGNNKFDNGGEEWLDWGIDQVQDSLEIFQSSSVLLPHIFPKDYIFDIDSGILESTPEISDSIVNLWISKIMKKDENILEIEISIQTSVILKGLQFELSHLPITKKDTISNIYEQTFSYIEGDKIFEDLNLIPRKTYSKDELDNNIIIDYSNRVSSILNFDSLNLFLVNGENIISNKRTNLFLYVDSLESRIDNEMLVYLTHVNGDGIEEVLSIEAINPQTQIIKIAMASILTRYQSGDLELYGNLKLYASNDRYNYSKLSILYNAHLDIMYSK